MVTYASEFSSPRLVAEKFNTLAERKVSRNLRINQLLALRPLDPSLPRDLGVLLIVKLFVNSFKLLISNVGIDLSGRD